MRKEGALDTPKHGKDGWPDRQILFGKNRHCWMEFKQLKGRLRAVQQERIRQMREAGELVYEPRSIEAAMTFFYEAQSRFFSEDLEEQRARS